MAQFVLHVPDIDASGKDFRFAIDDAWLASALAGSGMRCGGEGQLELHAQRQGADILVRGHVHVPIVASCVRCLGDARVDVDADVTSLFTARGRALRPEPDELELSPEDLEREFYSGSDITLDPVVRELVLVECPMQPLCADDCPGIEVPRHVRPPRPTDDGREATVDPRFAPLMKLARELSHNEE